MTYLRLGTKGFVFAVVLCLLGHGPGLPRASAVILVDDFTLPGVTDLFPVTKVAEFPASPLPVGDSLGVPLGDATLARIVTMAPILSLAQVTSGSYSGEQTVSLDTNPGWITSTSTGDGAPLFSVGYSTDDADNPLDLNVSGEDGVVIRYSSNLAVNVTVYMANHLPGNIFNSVSGNETTMLFPAGIHNLYIPFTDIDTALTKLDTSVNPAVNVELPAINLASLDLLNVLINPLEDATVPDGLVFAIDRITFIPEPASGVLLGVAGVCLMRRRRS